MTTIPITLTPELQAHLETLDLWWRHCVGRALDVGRRVGVPATPRARTRLAVAIARIAVPKQRTADLYAAPIEGGQ